MNTTLIYQMALNNYNVYHYQHLIYIYNTIVTTYN